MCIRDSIYTDDPFRMIGLIDVDIEYTYGIERVTLAFYRSSWTNSGKIQGLWYPIVGIKIKNGKFTEFSSDINIIMKNSTRQGKGKKGWLAKSIFFSKKIDANYQKRGLIIKPVSYTQLDVYKRQEKEYVKLKQKL